MGIGSCIHLDTTLLRNQCKYVNGCILLFFSPFTPHWSTPPCSCAAGQCSLSLSLSPSQSGSLVLTIKKLPIWLEEDIIAIMTAAALHITQYADCSSEQEEKGGGKHCLLCADATQYYHSVTTAHPHTQIHTDRVSTQFFSFFSPLRLCNLSAKRRANTGFYRDKNPYTAAFKEKKERNCNCQALGKHTLTHTVPPPIGKDRRPEWKSSLYQNRNTQLMCVRVFLRAYGAEVFGKADLTPCPSPLLQLQKLKGHKHIKSTDTLTTP